MKYLSAIKDFLETNLDFDAKLKRILRLKIISILNAYILVHFINFEIIWEDQKEKGTIKIHSPPLKADVIFFEVTP